jgi:hypothetical protein
MPRRTLAVTIVTAILVGGCATAAIGAASARLPVRPDKADWQKIEAAARLRNAGMARHRTAHFRVYAGSLGLSELSTIRPLAPGRCQAALQYLYGNLLDLQNAEPGENFAPLRRFVAREPSIRACAPRRVSPAR